MGAEIEERLSKRVTHVFAMNSEALLKQVGTERLARFKGVSFPFYLSLYYALLILHHDLQLSCCIVWMNHGLAILVTSLTCNLL